jgi:hypothetical protein
MIPGVYDLVYARDWDPTTNQVGETDAAEPNPHGMRVLQSGVTLAPGPNTLTVDIPVAAVSGNITLGGQPLPANDPYTYQTQIFLKSRDTGARHLYSYFDYTGINSALYGPVSTTKLIPGAYDVVYDRDWDPTTNQVGETDAADPNPHGMRVLQSNVTLAPGANTLDVDIPVAAVATTITLGGQPLPPNDVYTYQTQLFLRAVDTGAWHLLAYFDYTGINNALYGPVATTKVVPGVYDVLYARDWDPTTNQVGQTNAADPNPHGMRVLQSGVMLAPGANVLAVDIPVAAVSPAITLAGQPLPVTDVYTYQTQLFLKARDTGALHLLSYFDYTGINNVLYGPISSSKIVPGDYDILYSRDFDPKANQVGETNAADPNPHGERLLGGCISVQ